MKKLSVKEVSKCCGAKLKTFSSDDGTSFWVCEACDRATDPKPEPTDRSTIGKGQGKSLPIDSRKELNVFEWIDACMLFNKPMAEETKKRVRSSIERARREGGVEAIEMVVDEEMIDQWQRNVYLKMWREKSEF